jgi:hypothetical protein
MNLFSIWRRSGSTLAGISSLALSSLVLLCGAGTVPVENLLPQGAMQGDLNAGGHSLTNAATVSATNLAAAQITLGGVAMTNWPSGGGGSTNYDAAGAAATAQAYAVQRANHTGTQPASTATGLSAGATNSAAYLAPSATGAVGGVAPTINANPTGITLCVTGASISQGYELATNLVRYDLNFGRQLSQLPFFKNKLVSYATSGTITATASGTYPSATMTVASAAGIAVGQYVTGTGGIGTIPAGTIVSFVNGTTITLYCPQGGLATGTISSLTFTNLINTAVGSSFTATGQGSPVTAIGNWTGTTQTITLTTSPTVATSIGGSFLVTGTNIPANTYGTVSGTTLTLSQPTTASGSGVTLTFAGNNMTDRYATFIKPHRPTTNGGDGGAVAYLLIGGDTVINDSSASLASGSIVSALSSYISTAQADGFTVILCSTTPYHQATGWSASFDIVRQAVNAQERSQSVAAFGSNLIFADLARQICDVRNQRVTYYYSDGVHWALAGHTAVAYYLNSVLASGLPAPDLSSSVYGDYPYFNYGLAVGIGASASTFDPTYDIKATSAFLTAAGDWQNSGSLYAGYNTGTAAQVEVGSNGSIGFAASGGSGPFQTKGALFGQTSQGVAEIDYDRLSALGTLKASNFTAAGLQPVAPTSLSPNPAGSTTYKYKIVGYDASGHSVGASSEVTTTTGNATLDSTHTVAISVPASSGFYSCDIYRTFSGGTPSSTGKIITGQRVDLNGAFVYDNGQTADGTTPPTNNATGTISGNQLSLAATQTTVNASTSGSVVFSEPMQGGSLKMVVAYCNNSTGTASFTFPTAFTNAPAVVSTSGPAASVVTSLSASAITVTGSSTTGPLVLIGY